MYNMYQPTSDKDAKIWFENILRTLQADMATKKIVAIESAPSIDVSVIRPEDRPYVQEVIQYLNQNGLTAELKGSATEGNQKYNDVDILAKGRLEDVTNAVSGLTGLWARTGPFPKTAADDKEYSVTSEGKALVYMNTNIAQLFRIIVGDTKIHVGLKTAPVFGGKSTAAA